MSVFQNSLTQVANLLRAVGPDVLCLIIILVFAAIGWAKGFVKTAIQLVGGIVVLTLAFFISAPIAEKAFDVMFYEKIHDKVQEYVVSEEVSEIKNQIQGAVNDLPDWMNGVLESSGTKTSEDIYNAISDKFDGTSASVVDAVVDKVMRPIVTSVVRWICFLILAFLGLLLVPFLANVISKVLVFPGLGGIDQTLGMVVGIIQGIIIVFVFVTLISVLAKTNAISAEWISDSRIINFIDKINPSSNMIDKTFKSIFK